LKADRRLQRGQFALTIRDWIKGLAIVLRRCLRTAGLISEYLTARLHLGQITIHLGISTSVREEKRSRGCHHSKVNVAENKEFVPRFRRQLAQPTLGCLDVVDCLDPLKVSLKILFQNIKERGHLSRSRWAAIYIKTGGKLGLSGYE
jgi:hypothetical protein